MNWADFGSLIILRRGKRCRREERGSKKGILVELCYKVVCAQGFAQYTDGRSHGDGDRRGHCALEWLELIVLLAAADGIINRAVLCIKTIIGHVYFVVRGSIHGSLTVGVWACSWSSGSGVVVACRDGSGCVFLYGGGEGSSCCE